ncbi:MAG: hypothetical protein CMB54_06775, partial [Euryarchaeota archaeon]|nr:hypothetical protein [Euryarchaeota archaeon]
SESIKPYAAVPILGRYSQHTHNNNERAVGIWLGDSHTCVLLWQGSVKCWGRNYFGQLGDSSNVNTNSPPSNSIFGGENKVSIPERDIDGDGTLNIFQASMIDSNLDNQLSSGEDHRCAIGLNRSLGSNVYCWGREGFGNIWGRGDSNYQTTPSVISLPQYSNDGTDLRNLTWKTIYSKAYRSCAITTQDDVYCWGRNWPGGSAHVYAVKLYPEIYSDHWDGYSSISSIALMSGAICILTDVETVYCRGTNINFAGDEWEKIQFNSLPSGTNNAKVLYIEGGDTHACAIIDDLSVSCWGKAEDYTYGDNYSGFMTPSRILDRTPSPIPVRDLSIGKYATCVILVDNQVKCWGTFGLNSGYCNWCHYGNATPFSINFSQEEIPKSISVSSSKGCVILTNDSVKCWGAGLDSEYVNISNPVLSIDIHYSNNTCFIISNGDLVCSGGPIYPNWPNNGSTQLNWGTMTKFNRDSDRDGFSDYLDDYPFDQMRSVNCQPGSFGRYECSPSSPGSFVSNSGQLLQDRCPIGEYQPFSNQSSCIPADIGYYVENIGQTSQVSCPNGTTTEQLASTRLADCIDFDLDNDGVDDDDDSFPNDPTEWSDTDGDRVGDNSDEFVNDPTEWRDTDGDGVGDNSDRFPNNSSEWNDDDDDGFGNNLDEFPNDPSEWKDSDNDGMGDNEDDCPYTENQYTDQDGDGYCDNKLESQKQDAFPTDPTQWADQDGDGFGDNPAGTNADDCRTIIGFSTNDFFGCPDDDGDGWSNRSDSFPNDPTEWFDSDGDGVGDNSDIFPENGSEWFDSDGDGIGDNIDSDDDNDGVHDYVDVFPFDDTEWRDTDGDGIGDNTDDDIDGDGIPNIGDKFPLDKTEALDSDGDGIGDNSDLYPYDPLNGQVINEVQSEEQESSNMGIIFGSLIVIISTLMVVLIVVLRSQQKRNTLNSTVVDTKNSEANGKGRKPYIQPNSAPSTEAFMTKNEPPPVANSGPPPTVIGEFNPQDGYLWAEWPIGSGSWYYRSNNEESWSIFEQ